MGFLNHKGGAEYPYYKDDVFKAIVEVASKVKGLEVDKYDELSGHILIKERLSLWSWGQNILITVTEIVPGCTRVEIASTSKIRTLVFGRTRKNRANIEKIIEGTSRILSNKPPVTQLTVQ